METKKKPISAKMLIKFVFYSTFIYTFTCVYIMITLNIYLYKYIRPSVYPGWVWAWWRSHCGSAGCGSKARNLLNCPAITYDKNTLHHLTGELFIKDLKSFILEPHKPSNLRAIFRHIFQSTLRGRNYFFFIGAFATKSTG